MPDHTERLEKIKAQTLAVIEQMTLAPKPSYTIDGQQVSWGEYLRQLQDTVAWCNEQLSGEDPYEIHSQGCT